MKLTRYNMKKEPGTGRMIRKSIKSLVANSDGRRYGPIPAQDISSDSIFQSKRGSLENSVDLNRITSLRHFDDTLSKAGCTSLINYFFSLSNSANDEVIDVDYVDTIIRGGSDINCKDIHGQNIMNEIVRQWSIEAAEYVLSRGLNIHNADKFGRTPLHLAAALDRDDMVTWLIENGGDVHARSLGDLQSPIHFAAKSNSVSSLKVLLANGADINDRDFKQRTPIFVAAERRQTKMVLYLLHIGAPAGIFNDIGTPAMSVMIDKMPEIAFEALQQFITVEKHTRTTHFHLHYLEKVAWRTLSKKKNIAMKMSMSLSPLKAIVGQNSHMLTGHPVVLRLIHMKWEQFGKWFMIKKILFNAVYTLIWTSLSVTLPRVYDGTSKLPLPFYYSPVSENWWRIVLEIFAILMLVFSVASQMLHNKRISDRVSLEKDHRTAELERQRLFCHPMWPDEESSLEADIKYARTPNRQTLYDAWVLMEWLIYIAIVALVVTRIVFATTRRELANEIHRYVFPVVVILLWFLLMKHFRASQTVGPFIAMLGHVIMDTFKFLVLFLELFVPYVCGFWILFQGLEDYGTIFDVTFQVFLMTIPGDYSFTPLVEHDKIMAQLMVGTYLALAAVLCLNLYIALLSETFTRVFSNANSNSLLIKAAQIVEQEEFLPQEEIKKYDKQIMEKFAPESMISNDNIEEDDSHQLRMLRTYNSNIQEMMKQAAEICQSNTLSITEVTANIQQLQADVYRQNIYQQKILPRMNRRLTTMYNQTATGAIKRQLELKSSDEDLIYGE